MITIQFKITLKNAIQCSVDNFKYNEKQFE